MCFCWPSFLWIEMGIKLINIFKEELAHGQGLGQNAQFCWNMGIPKIMWICKMSYLTPQCLKITKINIFAQKGPKLHIISMLMFGVKIQMCSVLSWQCCKMRLFEWFSNTVSTPFKGNKMKPYTWCFLSTQLFIVWPLEMQMGFLLLQPFMKWRRYVQRAKNSKYSHFNDWVMILLQIG